MNFLCVTGTDTGVGKTIATAALASIYTAQGLRVIVVKPIQTGVRTAEPDDISVIRTLANLPNDQAFSWYNYYQPLAPHHAAEIDNTQLPLYDELIVRFRALVDQADLIIYEGAGGVLVPLTQEYNTIIDIAAQLDSPIILVVRPSLGTLNHTLLSVEAIKARSVQCAGIILGNWPECPNITEQLNYRDIPLLTEHKIIGLLPEKLGTCNSNTFISSIQERLDVAALMDLVYYKDTADKC